MKRRRVVITGVGVVSTIGVGTEQVTAALREGRSGVRCVEERRDLGFRSALTGVIDDFKPKYPLSRKSAKSMSEYARWAHESVMEALAMAQIPDELIRSPRTGIIFGNDSTATESFAQADLTRQHKSTSVLHSGMVFRSMNSVISMNLCSLLGTQGAAWTLSGACASGGHAVGQAAEMIASGRQDRIISGGGQETGWQSVSSFDALNAFSIREDDPEHASRPFDADRDGLVPSGGAAAIILEDMDLARERGAGILAEVLSYAFSSDGSHLALANGDGLAMCMADAIERAEVTPDRIDYISAHGTSTPQGDAVEAEAIDSVFKDSRPWVSSTKSMTGHEMWMSGASQVVYAVLMAQHGFIAGNTNFQRPDDRTACLRISPTSFAATPELVLCNSAGFGGTNSCLVLRMST